jgi:hypothetical protein
VFWVDEVNVTENRGRGLLWTNILLKSILTRLICSCVATDKVGISIGISIGSTFSSRG